MESHVVTTPCGKSYVKNISAGYIEKFYSSQNGGKRAEEEEGKKLIRQAS